MRKFVSFAGAAALLLGSATPAFAWWSFKMPSYDVTNKAYVDTNLTVKADTGDNTQKVYGDGSNELYTGAAVAAGTVTTFANLFDGCGCMPKGDVYNKADVDTSAYIKAETGDNYQKVSAGGQYEVPVFSWGYKPHSTAKNEMWTGNAVATGDVFTVVNSSWMPLAN